MSDREPLVHLLAAACFTGSERFNLWRHPEREKVVENALREAWDQGAAAAAIETAWIRCAERMPEAGVLVLAAVDASYPFFCEVVAWGGQEWKWPPRLKNKPRWAMGWMPTHWMPLPLPPNDYSTHFHYGT